MKNIRSLNKLAKQHDIQLIQGCGYLYWIPLTDAAQDKINMLYDTSVATNKFSDLTFDMWVNELNDFVNKLNTSNGY